MDLTGKTEGQERHLQFVAKRYPAWYVELCAPVTLALAAYAWQQAETGLSRAAEAKAGLDEITQPLLELVIQTQRFFMALHRDGPQAAKALWPKLQALLTTAGNGPGYETMRLRQLILHRCIADNLGWEELGLDELQLLLAKVPVLERTQYLWHELAKLAFNKGWDDLLRQAYSELSTINDGLLGGWFFNHSRLMLMLRTGEAHQEDVTNTMASIRFVSQIRDVRETVLPALNEQGWMSTIKLDALERRLILNSPITNAGLIK